MNDGSYVGFGGFGDAAETMRSRGNQQRSIVSRDVVEVQAQGDHARQHLERRSDVKCSVLACPGAEAFNLNPFHYRDRPVLMPTKSPIGTRCLVKKDGSNRTTGIVQDRSRHGADGSITVQERSQFGNTEQPYPGLINRLPLQSSRYSPQRYRVDGGGMKLRAVPVVVQGMLPQFRYRSYASEASQASPQSSCAISAVGL